MTPAVEISPQVLQRIWFVGFAGHRAVPDPAGAKVAISAALKVIQASIQGELVGIASAAAGADLLFLDACHAAKLKTVVLLPFQKERFAADFENPLEWEHACRCMDAAWWCEVTPGGEESPAAYHVVARESLEISDRMIFLWDGLPSRGIGGTAETLGEALERKIPSRVIDASSLDAKWNGLPPVYETSSNFTNFPAAQGIQDLFEKLDARANANAPRSRSFAAGSLSVNHLATILQTVLITFALAASETSQLLKLILASIAGALPWLKGRLRWQIGWVQDRTYTELLRSLLFSHEPCSPLRPPALDLFGHEKAFLRTAAMHLVKERRGWEIARDCYLKIRVEGQIIYLKSKSDLATKRMAVFGTLFKITSWSAVTLGSYSVIAPTLRRVCRHRG
jgi:hypothetical protein